MKTLRLRILSLLAALPILFGLLVPAVAAPCADGTGAAGPMTCDFCVDGVLAGGTICAAASLAVPAPDLAGARPPQQVSPAWFNDLALLPRGFDTPPDSPPPR